MVEALFDIPEQPECMEEEGPSKETADVILIVNLEPLLVGAQHFKLMVMLLVDMHYRNC